MDLDLELFRREVRVSSDPLVRLSAIDISPDRPKKTLVFLHGFGGQTKQWQYQLAEFSSDNRVIGLDTRGHGLSEKPIGTYQMDLLVADIARALDVLDISEKIILIGHSFGGAMATEFAIAHPHRLEHLILLATSGEYELNPLYRFLLGLPLRTLQGIWPLVRSWLGAPPHVLKPMHKNTVSQWNGWERFPKINVPTLVVRGHRDRIFQKQLFEKVPQLIPAAEEINVGASGHMVMLERREAVNRAIQRTLDAGLQSWRGSELLESEAQKEALLQKRPWLAHYDDGVPWTIALPQTPLTHLLRSAVRRFPLNTAILFEGKKITYRRLNREANRFANGLKSIGVKKGDRVMLLLPNIPQLVISFFGTLKIGAVAVFTLPTTEKEELVRQVRESGARALVTINQNGKLAETIQEATDLKEIIFTSPTAYLPTSKKAGLLLSPEKKASYQITIPLRQGMRRFQQLVYSQRAQSPGVTVSPDDLAAIIFTGGTTDQPKGVMLSHHNLVANALQTRHWIPDAQEGDERFLSVLPLTHSYGMTTAMNVPISLGATLILLPVFDIERVLNTIRRYRPTIFPGVPNMYMAIKDYPGVRRYKIRSIRACISGAAPLPVEVQEAFEKLTKGRLVEGYGLTEASPVTHGNPLNGLRKVGSIGIPMPSTDAKVVDLATGSRSMKVGQIGELAIRGPQIMAGYWGDEEGTRAVLADDGWLLTGDVVQRDAQGYFRLIARKADMWYPDRPETPAFPRDVEEVIYEIPQVQEAAVVAIANQPIAFISARQDRPKAEDIIAYCKRRLPPAIVPRLVIFVDNFPRSFIGKILRRELARHYEEHQKEQERP